MAVQRQKRRKLIKRLRNKYRLVIMNDDTFEERASWRLTPMNLFVSVGIFIISFTFLLTYIIAFTPLREYIPGYADVNIQRKVNKLNQRVEDLSEEMDARRDFLKNLQNVINDKVQAGEVGSANIDATKYSALKNLNALPRSEDDAALRAEVENTKN